MVHQNNQLKKEAIAPLAWLAWIGGSALASTVVGGIYSMVQRISKELHPVESLIESLEYLNPASEIRGDINSYILRLKESLSAIKSVIPASKMRKDPRLAERSLQNKKNAVVALEDVLNDLYIDWTETYLPRKDTLFSDWDWVGDVGRILPRIKQALNSLKSTKASMNKDLENIKGSLKNKARENKRIIDKVYQLHVSIEELSGVAPSYETPKENRLWDYVSSVKSNDTNAAAQLFYEGLPEDLAKLANDLKKIYSSVVKRKGFDFSDYQNEEVSLEVDSSEDLRISLFREAVGHPFAENKKQRRQKSRRRRPRQKRKTITPTQDVKIIQSNLNQLTQALKTSGPILSVNGVYNTETRDALLAIFKKYPKVEELFASRYGAGSRIVTKMHIMQDPKQPAQGNLAKALQDTMVYVKTGKEPGKAGETTQDKNNVGGRANEPTRQDMMRWLQTKTFSRGGRNVRVYDALSERGFSDTDMFYLLDRLYLSKNLLDMARWNPQHIKSALENRFRGA